MSQTKELFMMADEKKKPEDVDRCLNCRHPLRKVGFVNSYWEPQAGCNLDVFLYQCDNCKRVEMR